MSQCKIILENYNGRYSAGEEIRGRLECYFDEETSVRGIKVRIKCKEHNSWMGSESYYDYTEKRHKTRWVNYTGDNEPLTYERILFGSASGSSMTIGRGRHVYPFQISVPHNAPSTFNGPYGSISYVLKGIVDRAMRIDYEDSFIFVVVSPVDLTALSDDDYCVNSYSDEKTVCCWCCQGGVVTMDVELPRIAFTPTETVNFKVTITNLSNENVERLNVTLEKEITYKVDSPSNESKSETEDIVSISEHGVGAHGEHTYELQMTIPEYLDVPNFSLCRLFQSNYVMKVEAEMGACTSNLDIYITPHLGHITRGSTNDRYSREPGFSPPSNGAGAPPYDNAPPYPSFGDPSYPPAPGSAPYPPGPVPYPPGAGNAPYPSAPGASSPYPPASGASGYPPPPGGYPPSYSAAAGMSEKPVFSGGSPTAPASYGGSAPPMPQGTYPAGADSGSAPTAPAPSPTKEFPPPSYNDALKKNPPYPPQ